MSRGTASQYIDEYSCLADRLGNGKEAVDMISEFWQKLAYIEYQYAKSIAQLCNSRHGKLQKMFGEKTTEYFRPLQGVWGAVLEDLLSYAESHLNVAYGLQREAKPALNSFSQEYLSKQVEVLTHGKKVMTSLKEDQSKLEMERRRVYKTILSEHSEEMKEIKDDVLDNQNKTKQLQKLWIRSRDSHAHAFNVTMPSILEELNNTSVKRVETVCRSVGHFTTLLGSTSTTFKTTATALLAAQTDLQSVRHTMDCPSPDPPGDLQLNMSRSEMQEFCKNPATKFLNNIQDKVFPSNVGNMFLKKQPSSEDNSLKDISQKVSNMWTNIRTRTLSGNIAEPHAAEDAASVDEVLLDAEDEDMLDPGTVTGRPALDDAESTGQGRDVVILNFAASMSSPEPEHVEDTEVIEKDMIISLSNDPDAAEDYVVVSE